MAVKILIVDDDAVDRMAIKRALQKSGHDRIIQEAATGKEALSRIEMTSFDCIFLDYLLPDMDGINLLKHFYNSETDLGIAPVVMLTGQGNVSVMAEALRWGAQDYIRKENISPETLAIAVAKVMEVFELKKNRKQAEDRLRQSQKMEAVGQLTSGIAHDFNNLLTVILGNTHLITRRLQLAEGNLSRESLLKKIQAIETAAKSGAELIKKLMIFTRQRELLQEVVDINACVQGTHEMLKSLLGEMIEIKVLFAEGKVWPVEIDAGQFQNALINMAANARDAMPKGGRLTIETQNVNLDDGYAFRHPDVKPGPYVMVAVSDTGGGMTEDVSRRIFEPFFTTKKAGEGTGIGLSMVYGFIQQSDGHIHCYSEPGHGTVFRIYLPKMKAGEDSVSPDRNGPLPVGTETILIVENDEVFRAVAVNILGKLGYKTLEAGNGMTALQVLEQKHESISLVFTDIAMPGDINGIDLVRKTRERYPRIKALYTSGYTEHAIPDYQLVAGETLIGKPYRAEMLARKVRQILDGKQPWE